MGRLPGRRGQVHRESGQPPGVCGDIQRLAWWLDSSTAVPATRHGTDGNHSKLSSAQTSPHRSRWET